MPALCGHFFRPDNRGKTLLRAAQPIANSAVAASPPETADKKEARLLR
jgi:hypothetical protein